MPLTRCSSSAATLSAAPKVTPLATPRTNASNASGESFNVVPYFAHPSRNAPAICLAWVLAGWSTNFLKSCAAPWAISTAPCAILDVDFEISLPTLPLVAQLYAPFAALPTALASFLI